MQNKLPIALLALLGASLANADVLYSTSFEAPTFTAGNSIAGADGWYVGDSSVAASQAITSGLASDGSQGLRIASNAGPNLFSTGHMLPSEVHTFAPFSVAVDVYMDASTAANRTYELTLMSSTSGNLASNTVLFGMSIGGDGKVRAGSTWSSLFSSSSRATAPAGTFKSRWLTITLAVDENRNGVATLSGLDGTTPSYSYNVPSIGWDATTSTWKNIIGANLVADYISTANNAGVGTFDNFRVTNPVPEPATMAALGFGALALLRRRRKA